MASNLNPYEILLEDEQRVILKTRRIREEILDKVIEENGGVPTASRDIRVLNEVMSALDNQVLGVVDRRLKHAENENNQNVTELVATALMKLESIQAEQKEHINPEIPETFIPDDVVPGEMSTEYEEIELSEIMGDKE